MRIFHALGCILLILSGSLVAGASRFDDGQGAISGYDAVAYFTLGKAVKGKQDYHFRWQDIDWYFSSDKHRQMFQKNPQKYAPQNGGFCSWAASRGYLAPADPGAWHIEGQKLYVNYNKNVLVEFRKDLDLHIIRSRENWPTLVTQVPKYLTDRK